VRTSAGLLLYRRARGAGAAGDLEVLLVHPGGPYFARKDAGVWTIPKGEPNAGEALVDAARREFGEETGWAPQGDLLELTPVVQKGGKRVHAWAVEGDWDPARLVCNTFAMEWPPRSGQWRDFPEVDRARWCTLADAKRLMNPAQIVWLDELRIRLETSAPQARRGSPA
jgi:predicted NUDIX family NTP pyrophosphohydrolase